MTADASPPPQRPIAVVDIDGVVADVRHRLGHLRRRPRDWAAFFGAATDDPPLAVGVALVRELAADHRVVWLTGRPERLRVVTRRWLAAAGLPAGELIMRPDDDRRPARVFKAGTVRALARQGEVAVVLDDDPAVVETLRAAGLPVRLADWLPYDPALAAGQERSGRT